MGKHMAGNKEKKMDIPVLDGKTNAPMSWDFPTSLTGLVDSTNISSSGFKEVLSSTTPTQALQETITHPVVLAVVVGAVLLMMGRR